MQLTAYALTKDAMELVPLSHQREWMDQTPNAFAYRCLPLTIANQSGWALLCPCDVTVTWDGGGHLGALTIQVPDADRHWLGYIRDHFGSGILTFSIPYLFRTPPGYGLLVRGPANQWVLGAHALEGVVETDWSISSFTMNWRILEADRVVRFKKGSPICVICPIPLELLENMEPNMQALSDDPELEAHYLAWADSRARFNQDPKRQAQDWQKDYFLGKAPEGVAVREHRTRLKLQSFPPHPSATLSPGEPSPPKSESAEQATESQTEERTQESTTTPNEVPSGCPYHASQKPLEQAIRDET